MAVHHGMVHFNGAVTTFRVLKDRANQPVIDMLFRLLLLSILEDLLPPRMGVGSCPRPRSSARG